MSPVNYIRHICAWAPFCSWCSCAFPTSTDCVFSSQGSKQVLSPLSGFSQLFCQYNEKSSWCHYEAKLSMCPGIRQRILGNNNLWPLLPMTWERKQFLLWGRRVQGLVVRKGMQAFVVSRDSRNIVGKSLFWCWSCFLSGGRRLSIPVSCGNASFSSADELSAGDICFFQS